MEFVVLVVAAGVVAFVVASARRSGHRKGRASLFTRHEPSPGTVAVLRDVPDLDAHVAVDLLRSRGVEAELAVSRARPSLFFTTMETPTRYDVHVAEQHTSLARAVLAENA